MKYLITGLGNIGKEYENTRHNIGFTILDALAEASNVVFVEKRYGAITEFKFKGRVFVLLKPNTYVNLSGKAVNYWLTKTRVPMEKLLIIADDLSLPFGTLRLRPKGSDAGHNGLANITQVLGHQNYARLRFGIGNGFEKGQQANYVLGEWTQEEWMKLPERLNKTIEITKAFGTMGIQQTMNLYNNT